MAVTKCQGAGAIGVLVSLLIAAGLGATLYVTNRNEETTDTPTTSTTTTEIVDTTSSSATPCGHCGTAIKVTLRVENDLVEDNFNQSVDLMMNQRELIFFLQQAADTKEEFKFSANYGKYGYFITTMNGLTANYTKDKSWWRIRDGNNDPLNKGVSTYIPQDGETIIFSYVQGFGH